MSRVIFVDGVPHERDRDGDLRPVHDDSTDQVPDYAPGTPCAEHGRDMGQLAARCQACFSEMLAGDRPRSAIGLVYEPPQEERCPDARTNDHAARSTATPNLRPPTPCLPARSTANDSLETSSDAASHQS